MVQVFTGEFCEIFKSNFLQTATESLLLVGKKFVGKNFFLKFQNKLFWVKCAIFLCEQFTFTLQIQQYKHCRKVGICSELTIHQSNFSYFSSFFYRLTLNRWMRRGEMKFAEWDALIFDLMFWLKVFLNFPYFVSDIVLVSLLLTLNVFYTFYNFFHSWLWPCKYFLVELS